MDDAWSWAIGAVALGLMAGLAGAGLVWTARAEGRDTDPARRDATRAIAILTFLSFTVAGLLIASSLIDDEELDRIPGDIAAYAPRLATAALILLAGRAIALAAGSAILGATGTGSARLRGQLAALVRGGLTALAAVLALAELGVEVVVLQIVVAVGGAGLALAAALLVGLGGREVAADVAAGRIVRGLVRPGDRIEVGDVRGVVVGLHPATIEVRGDDGSHHHVAHSVAVRAGIRVDPT